MVVMTDSRSADQPNAMRASAVKIWLMERRFAVEAIAQMSALETMKNASPASVGVTPCGLRCSKRVASSPSNLEIC